MVTHVTGLTTEGAALEAGLMESWISGAPIRLFDVSWYETTSGVQLL